MSTMEQLIKAEIALIENNLEVNKLGFKHDGLNDAINNYRQAVNRQCEWYYQEIKKLREQIIKLDGTIS